MKDAVRLRGRRTRWTAQLPREVERVAQDPIDAAARESRDLQHHLVLAFADATADLRVLTLRVLAHHPVIRFALAERPDDTRQQAYRTEIHVLVELAADRYEHSPEGDVIGHTGEADRAEQDRVMPAQLGDPVLGHHSPSPLIGRAAPVEMPVRQ